MPRITMEQPDTPGTQQPPPPDWRQTWLPASRPELQWRQPVRQAFGSRMKQFTSLRHIATVLVLASLALPLSRCQRKVTPEPTGRSPAVSTDEAFRFEYVYAYDWFDLDEWEGWLALFTFSWPALVLLVRRRSGSLSQSTAFNCIETILAIGGGYMVWGLSGFGERLVGAYIAFAGMATYLFASLKDLLMGLRRRHKKTQTEPSCEADGENCGGNSE
jgi:hypothetical protein